MKEEISSSNYLSAVSKERLELSDGLTVRLAGILNLLHGESHSVRYWKILIGPYVNSAITRRIFLSEKVREMEPLFEPFNSISHPSKKVIRTNLFRYLVKALKSLRYKSHFFNTIRKHNNIAFGFHDPVSISQDVDAYIEEYVPLLIGPGNTKKRKELMAIASKEVDVYFANVIRHLPKIYVEHYSALMTKVKVYSPAEHTFHTSVIHSFFMRFVLARYISRGAKLYYYQHGAYYGEYLYHNAHRNEQAIADRYITWGWKLTEKDYPGKAYRLEKFRREYELWNVKEDIDVLFCYPSIDKRNREKFRSYTQALADKLDRLKYKVIVARPRPKSGKLFGAHELGFELPNTIQLDSGKTQMTKLLRQSKLILQFTVPSTNFAECLYVDQPTIGLLENDQPTDIVKPYYEFFLQEGVLHPDFDSLLNHLNTIDLEEWWGALVQHPTYRAFKDEFLKKV